MLVHDGKRLHEQRLIHQRTGAEPIDPILDFVTGHVRGINAGGERAATAAAEIRTIDQQHARAGCTRFIGGKRASDPAADHKDICLDLLQHRR
jgi:hypothetical protein